MKYLNKILEILLQIFITKRLKLNILILFEQFLNSVMRDERKWDLRKVKLVTNINLLML